jgi:hypothetical protein
MLFLVSELKNFFKKDKNLKNFMPKFQKLMNDTKIEFKKEHLLNKYSRNILYKNDDFEIVLITWGAYSRSPIHCHPKNGCLLTVLDGTLFEERYDKNGELYEYSNFLKGDFGYMHCNLGKHRITNMNDFNCYSLHIYSPSGFYK